MDNIFLLNPSLSTLDLQDAINERFTKVRIIVNCLVAAQDGALELDRGTIYQIIWIVKGFFDEIETLDIQSKKIKRRTDDKQKNMPI